MGYYSNFDWIVREPVKVNKEKVKELEKFFADSSNEDIYAFLNVKVDIDDKGKLIGFDLEEYYGKFYDDELFADKFSEVVEEGIIDLIFKGEDGSMWGYRVFPNKVEELRVIFATYEEYEKTKEYFSYPDTSDF